MTDYGQRPRSVEVRKDLYVNNLCIVCAQPKQHTEWVVCDDHFNLAHPALKQPGMGPS